MFPEGTRNRDGKAKPMSGAARMKVSADVPMIPVVVIGTDRVRLFPPRLPRFECVFGEALQDDDLAELEDRWKARRLTERWSAAIAGLRS